MSLPEFRYEPFPDVELPLTARLGQYPRQPDLLLDTARAIGRRLAAGCLRLQCRLEVVGSAPDLPRVAIMANHQSHLDTLAILAALPERYRRRVTVLAARDYFFDRPGPALAANLFGQAVAFDRESELAELHRLARLLPTMPAGWFLIYPSGSRKRLAPRVGLAGVLARSGWTVLPTALAGTAEAWPVGSALWRPFRRVRVTFGEPIGAAGEHELPAKLMAFWSEHGGLDAGPRPVGQPIPDSSQASEVRREP